MSIVSDELPKIINDEVKLFVPKYVNPIIFTKRIRNECLYFLDLMRRKWVNYQADGGGWILLNAEVLRQTIHPRKLGHVKKELQEFAGLEVNHSYSKGNFSKSYRLADGFSHWHRITIRDKRLAKRLRQRDYQSLTLPVHKHLKEHFSGLTVDMEQARKLIGDLRAADNSACSDDDYRSIVTAQVEEIDSGEPFFKVDMFGRCHSRLSNLPCALRSALRLGDSHLVSIDLVNSQPLICGLVANQYFSSDSVRHSLLSKEFNSSSFNSFESEEMREMERMIDAYYKENSSKETPSTTTTVLCCTNSDPNTADLTKYLETCSQGKFYELFTTKNYSRDQAKKGIFNLWFGKPHYSSTIKDIMKNEHPTVIRFLDDIKKKNYQRAAWTLQNYEARIFIGTIATRIMNEHPDIPFLTLHDAIYTIPQYVEYIEFVIVDEFERLGVTPTLKITHCKNENK